MRYFFSVFIFVSSFLMATTPKVELGIDNLLKNHLEQLENKKIGLFTNHTAINKELKSSIELLKENNLLLTAIFAPEHGLDGSEYAGEKISNNTYSKTPVYSLHGETRRPTKKMLQNLDIIICDIQEIGSRSYTYISTLCYIIEAAKKENIKILITDRPNPINGITIDGPMLEKKFRSFVGYLDVPYCHGMTIGELALFFNQEYNINADIQIIPMQGWKREMSFSETGLTWIPTSPQIPEKESPMFYPITGIIGEISLVNIGVGYTLPFKIIGAPFIDSKKFTSELNKHNFPGVKFIPYTFKPFFGKFKEEKCFGSQIIITDHLKFKPLKTQYLILGILKNLYPKEFKNALAKKSNKTRMFNLVNGTDKIYNILSKEEYVIWPLINIDKEKRELFTKKRAKYLLY